MKTWAIWVRLGPGHAALSPPVRTWGEAAGVVAASPARSHPHRGSRWLQPHIHGKGGFKLPPRAGPVNLPMFPNSGWGGGIHTGSGLLQSLWGNRDLCPGLVCLILHSQGSNHSHARGLCPVLMLPSSKKQGASEADPCPHCPRCVPMPAVSDGSPSPGSALTQTAFISNLLLPSVNLLAKGTLPVHLYVSSPSNLIYHLVYAYML